MSVVRVNVVIVQECRSEGPGRFQHAADRMRHTGFKILRIIMIILIATILVPATQILISGISYVFEMHYLI